MRLLELEIHNVRGIPDLLLEPNGKNIVIWGPNGAGKSAVVDSVDFLLTGKISRLMGKGTGGISLANHGAHIDHAPEEASVRAILALPGVAKPVEVERCMAKPKTLQCDKATQAHLRPILNLAERGQHVLTRRDILKYITAEPGTRAQEIQALLNVSELEKIRKALVTTLGRLRTECDAARRAVTTAESALRATLQIKAYDEKNILRRVNETRKVLGGQPISELSAGNLLTKLPTPVTLPRDKAVNVTLFERDIHNVRSAISADSQAKVADHDTKLRDLLAEVRVDPQLQRELDRRQLTQLGISLLDDSGNCPLCDKPWPPGKLREYLENRIKTAQAAAKHQARIGHLSAEILAAADDAIARLQDVTKSAKIAGVQEKQLAPLLKWTEALEQLTAALQNPLEKYPDDRLAPERVKQLLAPEDIDPALAQIRAAVQKKCPKTTPEQTAWEILTRLDENLKALERAQAEFEYAETSQQRADILLSSFERARDSVLEQLYDEISARFSELYRRLHGADESAFGARIHPHGAGLDFEVDFFGRGTHPPHALHSEGHQDSMGLCLYLALAERLTEGLIDLTILDDVVMSIDAGHRRRICDLLITVFPNKQFLITTHDKTWATQLRSEGVVTSRGSFEFGRWTIETGPVVSCEVGLWDLIDRDLQKGDIPNAAFRLRRGSEHFFEMACDALQAPVRYRSDSRWELGNFLPAAIGQYGDWLKAAKTVAQSWGDQEGFEELQERDTVRKQIISRVNEEWWAVNSSVHYNKWTEFSEGDFRPVAEVFRDLCGLFRCGKCGGMLYVACTGPKPVSVRCNCGSVNWNLQKKPK
jgi:DNA repair exonuclease SbcCD ATPase subunit